MTQFFRNGHYILPPIGTGNACADTGTHKASLYACILMKC